MGSDLRKEADDLLAFVASCVREDGVLYSGIDGKTKVRNDTPLLSDFGDWAPFFVHFGRNDVVEAHIRALPRYVSNGLLKPTQKKFGIPATTAFEHTDLLLGLLDCTALGIESARKPASDMLQACIRVFDIGNKGIKSYFFPNLGIALPITSSVDATYIELLVQAGDVLGEASHIDRAERLADHFLALPFVRTHHLLPEISGLALGKRTRRVQTMKHNTNAVFALLELYRVRPRDELREALTEWIGNAAHLRDESGYIFFSVTREGAQWVGDKVDIVPHVGLLDAITDCAYMLRSDAAKKLALSLGEKLLALQDASTGLVRRSPTVFETHMDAQTDLVIAWEKLSEVTGDRRFSAAASALFDAVRRYHKYEKGYVYSCDSRSGEIVSYRTDIKYNALFLKPYLRYLTGGPIYGNERLSQLLKDR